MPNIFGRAEPINVYSTALMNVGGTKVLPSWFQATPRTEPTVLTVQDLAQLLAYSRKDHLLEWKLAQNNEDLPQ